MFTIPFLVTNSWFHLHESVCNATRILLSLREKTWEMLSPPSASTWWSSLPVMDQYQPFSISESDRTEQQQQHSYFISSSVLPHQEYVCLSEIQNRSADESHVRCNVGIKTNKTSMHTFLNLYVITVTCPPLRLHWCFACLSGNFSYYVIIIICSTD